MRSGISFTVLSRDHQQLQAIVAPPPPPPKQKPAEARLAGAYRPSEWPRRSFNIRSV